MYLKTKITIISLFAVLLLGIAPVAIAQTKDVLTGSTLVADVSIKNGGILSQQNNKININFDLVNGDGVQTNVRYGVMLVPKGGTYIADEKVYDESLNLAANTTMHRDIIYTAPSVLSGNYDVYLESKSENNLPFDVRKIGSVTLAVGIRGVYIDPTSCFLQLAGDKTGKHFSLTQSIDINASESLRLTCSALNQTANTVTVTPSVETHLYSQFGATAETASVDNPGISLETNTTKTFTVTLPKGTKPQLYSAKFSVAAPNIASNSIYVGYIINGIQASVQQVSLDKQSYTKGDMGELSLVWSAVAGNFSRSGNKNNGAPGVSVKATITSNGTACAAPINQALARDPESAKATIPFEVTKNCKNPEVSVQLTDLKGNVLDEETTGFKPTQEKGMIGKTTAIIAGGLVLLIAIVGVVILKRKHRATAEVVTE